MPVFLRLSVLLSFMLFAIPASAQARSDSTRSSQPDSAGRRLKAITIEATRRAGTVGPAPRLAAGMITTGAKSEVVSMVGMSANLAEKTGRQVFAEVPGIFVYDMDGSGNQVNISARGLDAHRSWEFNVRQNGVLMTSDVYAYPASHYSPPMEAIDRIELVRGTAALQYGSQFGGLLNYVIRSPDTTRVATVESRSSTGSNGLASTWNAVGGRVGRVSYHAYASLRRSDGYRANGRSTSDAEYVSASVPLASSLLLRAEVGRSRYLYQQPGPLSDAMFNANARASTRSRNWYSPDIMVPSLTLTWTPSQSTRATLVASGVFGTRSSVAVGGFATQPDTPSASGLWSARQVDIDRYDSRTVELRGLHDMQVASRAVGLSIGLALTDNDMRRRQRGTGSRGSDYSLALRPGGDFQRDLSYRTSNIAVYAESEIRVTPRWTIVPGARVERGITRMTGILAYYDPADTPRDIRHRYPLFGLRSAFVLPTGAEWYGGWSQAYRPMILKDVLPETASERTDRSLRDARGWTVETGMRGGFGSAASYDVALFAMRYANRFGMLTITDASGTPLTFKTNVGTTRTMGLETRLALPLGVSRGAAWRAFTAASYMNARYIAGSVIANGKNVDIRGNEIESAPKWIVRGGVGARAKSGEVSMQVSNVSRTFADALNTASPGTTGAVGVVPAYTLLDLTGSWRLSRAIRVMGGINNLLDRRYFTKRPQFYPGPGVWPSDGRTLQLSVHLTSGAGY